MKIKRQDAFESSEAKPFWLHEFAYDLDKKANTVDYLKEYLNKNYKNKKFNTIEEKLADIKERVGFDLATKVVNEIEKTSADSNTESSKGCGCKKCEKCGDNCTCKKSSCECSVKTAKKKKRKKPERDVKIMKNILKYIKDMIIKEPHLDLITVMDRCKNDDGLRYEDIKHKIDHKKLKKYIKNLLSENGGDDSGSLSVYVPRDSDDVDPKDGVAQYFQHAERPS